MSRARRRSSHERENERSDLGWLEGSRAGEGQRSGGVDRVCASCLLAPALVGAADGGRSPEPGGPDLIGVSTGRQAELRETVAITAQRERGPEAVLSLALPRVKRGDRIRFNGEVTVTTTCVQRDRRCIGRRYRFDPRLRAQIVLAGASRAAGARHVAGLGAGRGQLRAEPAEPQPPLPAGDPRGDLDRTPGPAPMPSGQLPAEHGARRPSSPTRRAARSWWWAPTSPTGRWRAARRVWALPLHGLPAASGAWSSGPPGGGRAGCPRRSGVASASCTPSGC